MNGTTIKVLLSSDNITVVEFLQILQQHFYCDFFQDITDESKEFVVIKNTKVGRRSKNEPCNCIVKPADVVWCKKDGDDFLHETCGRPVL